MTGNEICVLLSKKKFIFSNEKDVQLDIEQVLKDAGVNYRREVVLDARSKIDFMIGTIGLEVKIKGGKADIYKQLERYCKLDSITEIILQTSRSMGIPNKINGKPVYVINMGMAWL